MSDKKLHIEDELKEAVTIGLLVELIEKLQKERDELKEIDKSLYGQKVEPVTFDEFTDSLESILDRDFGENWDYKYEVNDDWINISLNIPYIPSEES